ncbi:MAG: hypothetical protein ACKV0T_14905 [Planctomycetales bacterium]
MINFESLPSGAPSDGLAITTQYASTLGVTFSLENGSPMYLAQVGGARTAFEGPAGADLPASGQGVGAFFLTDKFGPLTPAIPQGAIIGFSTLQGSVSGDILDIDGVEAWRVEARDASGAILDSQVYDTSHAEAGDGIATTWSFQRSQNSIASIRIAYIGGTLHDIGFALDNFAFNTLPTIGTEEEVTDVPEPSGSWSLVVIGAAAAFLRRWRLLIRSA